MRVQDIFADAVETLRELPNASVDCVVADPDVRRVPGDAVVDGMQAVWTALHRVLRPTGNAWLLLGDRHAGNSLTGLPWRVAFALQRAGWLLRNAVVVCPEEDCLSTRTAFLWVRRPRYFFDLEPLRSSGTHPGDVVLPGSVGIVERCVAAGCPAGGVVLGLFGRGEAADVAHRLGRRVVGRPSRWEAAT